MTQSKRIMVTLTDGRLIISVSSILTIREVHLDALNSEIISDHGTFKVKESIDVLFGMISG